MAGKRKRGGGGAGAVTANGKVMSTDTFIVDRILGRRVGKDGIVEYLLSWEGYPESYNSWEPRECVMCSDLIDEFERKLAKQQANKPPLPSPPPPPPPLVAQLKNGTPSSNGGDNDGKASPGDKRRSLRKMNQETSKLTGFDRGWVAEKILGLTRDDGDDDHCKDNDSCQQQSSTGGSGVPGEVHWLIKWKNHTGAELIPNSVVRRHCPSLLIQFYQSNISWSSLTNNKRRRRHKPLPSTTTESS